jgi:hypothetical protein
MTRFVLATQQGPLIRLHASGPYRVLRIYQLLETLAPNLTPLARLMRMVTRTAAALSLEEEVWR